MILEKSSFYVKAGGQEANLSTVVFEGGEEIVVSNVQTRWNRPPLWGGIWQRCLSHASEGSKFKGMTAIPESLIANGMPALDKEAGALHKDLEATKLSTALKSELRMDQSCPKEGH